MFVLNEFHPPNLQDYGIQLPVPPERFLNCKKWVTDNMAPSNIKWLKENYFLLDDFLRCHSEEFVKNLFEAPDNLVRKCFELDEYPERFIQSKSNKSLAELAERILFHSGGTYLASKLALERGHCFFVGGGYHHAQTHGPSGFCLVNDIILAIRKLQHEKLITSAWVIDVDAHMGDGSAQMTEFDDSITTLSIHMAKGWPLQGPNPYPIHSDIDLPIEQFAEDKYCTILEQGLSNLVKNYPMPDLIIFNQGADPFEEDTLKSTSGLNLSLAQMIARDEILYQFADEKDIPACYVLSGGYGPNAHKPSIAFWELLKKKNIW